MSTSQHKSKRIRVQAMLPSDVYESFKNKALNMDLPESRLASNLIAEALSRSSKDSARDQ